MSVRTDTDIPSAQSVYVPNLLSKLLLLLYFPNFRNWVKLMLRKQKQYLAFGQLTNNNNNIDKQKKQTYS